MHLWKLSSRQLGEKLRFRGATRRRRLLFEQYEDRRLLAIVNDDVYYLQSPTEVLSRDACANDQYVGDWDGPYGTEYSSFNTSPASHGSLTENGSGCNFTYTPDNTFVDSDSFTYAVYDNGPPGTATVSIILNEPPVTTADTFDVLAGWPLTVSGGGVLENDTDPNAGQSLTAVQLTTPAHGTLALSASGGFTYAPDSGYVGWDAFTYYAFDGYASSSTTVQILVNAPPVAADDSYTTPQDTELLIGAPGILANDTDANGGLITSGLASEPAHGTLEHLSNGLFRYTPHPGFSGTDSFTYRASDGSAYSNLATVTITVLPISTSLLAVTNSYATAGGATIVKYDYADGVLANDTFPSGSTPTAWIVDPPTQGELTFYADGTFRYVPSNGFFTLDSFTYRFHTAQGVSSLGVVTITNSLAPEITLSRFYSDGQDLLVQYAVLGESVGRFTINVYASPDGFARGQLLESRLADNSQGLHTLRIEPTFADPGGDYYLLAVVDPDNQVPLEVNENNNQAKLLPGSFLVHEPATASTPAKTILHVHGSDNNDYPVYAAIESWPGGWNVYTSQTVLPAPTTGTLYDVTGDGLVTYVDAAAASNYSAGYLHAWQNLPNRFDVDNDGVAAPIDALILINDNQALGEHILQGNTKSGPYCLDVSGDRVASVLDLAQLLDHLNGGAGNEYPPTYISPSAASANFIEGYLSQGRTNLGNITIDEVVIRVHAGDDLVTGVNGAPARIYGGPGLDALTGSDLADILDGGAGNDSLYGMGGNDLLYGASGDDYLFGDFPMEPNPWFHPGSDTLFGGDGNDFLYGHAFADELFGDAGNDLLEGHAGDDELSGGDGTDTLTGHDGDDTLSGGSGNDTLNGDSGSDHLHGDEGSDALHGGTEIDVLYGGAGTDTLDGGAADDLYIPNPPAASPAPVTNVLTELSIEATTESGVRPIYTWSAISRPAGAAMPMFYNPTTSNTGHTVTASFNRQGTYRFWVTMNHQGVIATEEVSVTVVQTPTSIDLSPWQCIVPLDGRKQFTAIVGDQFGHPMDAQPTVAWSITSGPGIVGPGGWYTGTNSGLATIQAATSGIAMTATVNVTEAAAAITPHVVVVGTSAQLTIGVPAGSGNSNVIYTWTVTSMPAGASPPQLSDNASSTANHVTATFTSPGAYTFMVTIDQEGVIGTSEASATVEHLAAPTGLAVVSVPGNGRQLTWNAANGAAIYDIYRQPDGGSWVLIGSTTATNYADTTVTFEGKYAYGVVSRNSAESSAMAQTALTLVLTAEGDYDHDGLNNLTEYNLGTNPAYFDTDGDLLPDGWEFDSGLDPTDSDENSNGISDLYDDFDDDDLTNLGEFNQSSEPTDFDTDNDGASDGVEVGQGSDPTDASDGGQAPASDMKAQFTLTVGDSSGSQSERWAIHVGDNIRHTSTGFGQVGSGNYYFKSGESYDITLAHLGTRPEFLAQSGGANTTGSLRSPKSARR